MSGLESERASTGTQSDTRVSMPAECAEATGFNVITGEAAGGVELNVEALLAHFPVALLAFAPGEDLTP